jgi:gliding motility-associated lipoprotein GldB
MEYIRNNSFFFNIPTKSLAIILFVFFILSGCKDNPLDLDTSDIQIDIKVQRLEKELFSGIDEPKLDSLKVKYGDFFARFVQDIIRAGYIEDPGLLPNLAFFINDNEMKEVYGDVIAKYPSFTAFEDEFKNAFKRYRYYFPDKKVPDIVTYVSGFNYALAANDSTLGVGLDFFLGRDYKFYKLIGFPNYKTLSMAPEYLVSDAIKGWVATEFEFDPIDENLLNHMVHHGKIMYILDALMPSVHDTIKIAYTKDQLEWSKSNESHTWAYLIDKDLLFTTNPKEIMKFMNEGPFTSGLPKESPGRLGVWIGWQIVRQYMRQQDETDLYALMNKDEREILKDSKYKPKK